MHEMPAANQQDAAEIESRLALRPAVDVKGGCGHWAAHPSLVNSERL